MPTVPIDPSTGHIVSINKYEWGHGNTAFPIRLHVRPAKTQITTSPYTHVHPPEEPTQWAYDVYTTSFIKRHATLYKHHVSSSLIRRCINAMCPLGTTGKSILRLLYQSDLILTWVELPCLQILPLASVAYAESIVNEPFIKEECLYQYFVPFASMTAHKILFKSFFLFVMF